MLSLEGKVPASSSPPASSLEVGRREDGCPYLPVLSSLLLGPWHKPSTFPLGSQRRPFTSPMSVCLSSDTMKTAPSQGSHTEPLGSLLTQARPLQREQGYRQSGPMALLTSPSTPIHPHTHCNMFLFLACFCALMCYYVGICVWCVCVCGWVVCVCGYVRVHVCGVCVLYGVCM